MKPNRLAGAMAAALAATLATSACGRSPAPSPLPAPAPADSLSPLVPSDAQDQADGVTAQERRAKLIAELGLTTEQQDKLKAIKAKYQGMGIKSVVTTHVTTISSLLSAPSLDRNALRNEFTQLEADWKAKLPTFAQKAGEMRDVMTADQKTKLLSILTTAKGKLSAKMDRLIAKHTARVTTDLSLTEAQQQGLNALVAQMKPIRLQQANAAIDAFNAFVASGDQTALATQLGSLVGETPYDTSIDWLNSLTPAQRQTLSQKIPTYMQEHMAEHDMD